MSQEQPPQHAEAADDAGPRTQEPTRAGTAPEDGASEQEQGRELIAPPTPLLADDASVPELATVDAVPEGGDLDELVLPSLVSAPEPLSPGTEIGPEGRLRVVEHVGARGRLNRYAATWRQDDGREIDVELREGPADHAGLQREAEILAAVQYAMLPRCYLACEQDGRRYLALDHLDGETLERALATGLSVDRALSIVLQLTQVVRRLHRAGWALLGLRPADVALGQPVRITSLGQAGRIDEPPPQALHVAGYSAPELAYQEAVTGKEDVYTLGALLYHALTGRPLSENGVDVDDLSGTIRLPGAPQLLADVLTPADDRLDLEALYRRLLDLNSRQADVSLSLEVASATTVGLNPTRLVNEDSCGYAIWSQTGADGATETALLCVADGMGGMEAGEIASQTAVNVVMRTAANALWPAAEKGAPASSNGGDRSPHHDARPTERHDEAPSNGGRPVQDASAPRLDPAALVLRAATAVHAAAHGRNLGTTITCAVVHGGVLTLAHVGDTRAYLLRDGVLTRLTADHSLVAAMVASGVISAEEAEGHPDSNKVLRSLGSQRELPAGYVDGLQAAYGTPSLTLVAGDWLVLCSDGVWGTVADREIQIVTAEALSCQNAARALVDRALQGGAPDNATAIVARAVARPVL